MPEMSNLLNGLLEARQAQALIVSHEQAKLAQLDAAILALETQVKVDPRTQVSHRQDMVGLGIIGGTKKLFDERAAGAKLTTREIADELRARGVTTISKRFVPTVYATLANQMDEFTRDGTGWLRK